MEFQSRTVENANSEDRATPWLEVELNPLSASEKAIGYGNTVNSVQTVFPYSCSDKPVLFMSTTSRSSKGRLSLVLVSTAVPVVLVLDLEFSNMCAKFSNAYS